MSAPRILDGGGRRHECAIKAEASTNAAQMNFGMAVPQMTIFEATANSGFCFSNGFAQPEINTANDLFSQRAGIVRRFVNMAG